jgi:hypothetical protein
MGAAAMRTPKHKGLNSFYSYRYRRYGLRHTDEPQMAGSPQKMGRIKEVLVHIGLFIAGLVVGTVVGLIVLSLAEQWLSNGG